MALTPAEILEKALNGESLDGDKVATGQSHGDTDGAAGAKGATVDAANATGDAAKQKTEADDEPVGAPIASKSGAYTIPYEKLDEARTRAKTLETENEALRKEIAELSAQQQANIARAEERAQDRADAGQAQTQADANLAAAKEAISAGADVSLFGDFSEEALAKGIKSLVAMERDAMRAELRADLEREFAPMKAKQAQEQSDSHTNAILGKHPDAYEVVQSAQFDAWMKSLPSFSRAAVAAVLDPATGGTADQVIEVFDAFKTQTGRAAAPVNKSGGKAPEVQRRVPNSLSEMAGEQHQDIAQQVMASAGTDNAALLERMQDMTPEQIERVMNAI